MPEQISDSVYFYNEDVDQYVLGICLFDPESVDYFKSIGVNRSWFRSPRNKIVWDSIIAVTDSGESCDVVNVSILFHPGDSSEILAAESCHAQPNYTRLTSIHRGCV